MNVRATRTCRLFLQNEMGFDVTVAIRFQTRGEYE